jgi:hypothetical protein
MTVKMKYKLIKFLKISISIAAAVTSSILQAQEMDYRTSLEEALRAFHSGSLLSKTANIRVERVDI